ncbi:MAG: hypothetical protein KAS66_12955, partial [Candidatus Omnitrophica bacterium]|nr:hypothetical protein [Candidatus Omnitrophota bacterium]
KLAIETEERLSKLNVNIPYFQMLVKGFRSLLLDFVNEKQGSETLLSKLKKFAAENLVLQPNIFGIGINFNEMLKSSKPERQINDSEGHRELEDKQ